MGWLPKDQEPIDRARLSTLRVPSLVVPTDYPYFDGGPQRGGEWIRGPHMWMSSTPVRCFNCDAPKP